MAPKDEWQTEPTKAPTNKYWESFIFKGSKFYGDIPYAKHMLETKKIEQVKNCFKELLYGATMIDLGRIVEYEREIIGKDFNTDIIIEMNW